MSRSGSVRARLACVLACVVVALTALTVRTSARASCALPPLSFSSPVTVDPVRAGGEPSVWPLPDGTILYSAHAGTTHLNRAFMPDPDFVTPYSGATYLWRSTDDGATWRYVGFDGGDAGPHATVSGFSDPTLATDAAGNVYIAGINLANVYVARSDDSGRTWQGHPFAAFLTDREWLAADEEDVVYLNGTSMALGRRLWKSRDGGTTWNWTTGIPLAGGGPPSPVTVDPADGRVYFPVGGETEFEVGEVQILPSARDDVYSDATISWVFDGLPHTNGFLNPSAIDAAGNVYIVSNTFDEIRVASSSDRGQTWTTTVVHRAQGTVLWPWIAAGDDGLVGVSWLESDDPVWVDSQPASYRVMAAQSGNAHGGGCAADPVWSVATVTPDPIHSGVVCTGGLGCVASGVDRRLGDYHTNAITADGRFVIAYGETASDPGGAISHPAFVAQSGGVDFRD